MFLVRAALAVLCRIGLLLSLAISGGSIAIIGVNFPFAALIAAALVRWRCRRRSPPDSHGSARLTTTTELLEAGYLSNRDDALILGRVGPSPPPSRMEGLRMLCNPSVGSTLACQAFLASLSNGRAIGERLIRVRGGVTHLSTIAPTGKGKGVSVLIPNLLAYSGSCVVFDPKGELLLATGEHRHRHLHHKIYVLAPFGLGGDRRTINYKALGHDRPGSDTYNPLSFLDSNDPFLLERCRDIGNQIVIRAGTEHEPHWNDTAENICGNLLYFICLCEDKPQERNLESLCNMVSSREKFARAISTMQKYPDPLLQELGDTLGWLRDRELNSAMSTVLRHVKWMQSPSVEASLQSSSFDPRALREQPATLYLVLPAEFITVMQPLLRIWIGNILRVVTRRGAIESDPILFLIDEAAQIGGQMRALEDAVRLYRGYGIRCWFFWQAQDQMKECFGERANIIQANMDVTQYFGISDTTTADGISQRIGEATIEDTSVNDTTGRSRPTGPSGPHPQPGSISESTSVTTNNIARQLYDASEITRIPEVMCLIFIRSYPVIAAWLVRWYADAEFRRGGTGRQRGLGLAAGIMATFMLLASIMAAGFASKLPLPGTPEWTASSARWEAARLNYIQRQRALHGMPPLPSAWPYNGPQAYPPVYRRPLAPPWQPQRGWPQRSPYGY